MEINLKNYEACFLDYLEGRLDTQSKAELEAFLSLHPQLSKELEHFEQITIAAESIECPDKNSLKKFQFYTAHINKKNFDDFCIAWYEHQLTDEKAKELLDYMSINPDRNQDFYCYRKIYLKPQSEIVFCEKNRLYKKVPHRRFLLITGVRWLSIAASLAIITAVYLKFNNQKSNHISIQVASSIQSNHPFSNKATEDSKSIQPQFGKKPKALSYNNLNNKYLGINNLIDTLKKDKLDPSNDDLRETDQIAFIQSRKITNIEINSEDNLNINLDKFINYIDNQNKEQPASLHNIFEHLTEKLATVNNLKNRTGKLSFIKLVQVGISGINLLTNANMKLTEKTDTLGNVRALSFESGAFEYQRIKGN